MTGEVKYINSLEANEFLLNKHYSGRKPQITVAFGWYIKNELVAVCTFGKPASSTLCDGVCGNENSKSVYELNRLCRIEGLNLQISQFVSACIRRISINNWIIVSYADSDMNHNGYVYQSCNFKYTGCTKKRLEFHVDGGHSRHGNKNSGFRKIRTPKHRYVYFATNNRKIKQQWEQALNYPILPYPKGENKNYVLGEFQKPVIVKYP